MKLEDLQSSLEAHEQRIKERNENHTQAQAMQARINKKSNQDGGKYNKGKGKSKWHKKKDIDESEVAETFKNQNNNSSNNIDKGKKKFNKKGIQCYNCQKCGHFANECRSKKVKRKDDETQLAQADSSDLDEVLLMAVTSPQDDCLGLWYLDISCSNHMTGHKEQFVSIDEKVKREIRFADNSSVTAKGVGKVLIQRKDGKQTFIYDVLYVPNMKKNL